MAEGGDNLTDLNVAFFQISYFKIPKHIIFVDDFPRTPTGKAQKYIMVEKSCQLLNIIKN